jgi:hypothetical protein
LSEESTRGVLPETARSPEANLALAVPEGADRRKQPRYVCEGSALISLPHGGLLIAGSILNVSATGCYIEAPSINLERGTQVEVYFETRKLHFRVAGNITVLRPRIGVGIAFLKLSHRAGRQIAQLVKELAENQ